VFHATDIFHGRGYWRAVQPAVRFAALRDLAKIIDDLALPVIVGGYEKEGFGGGVLDVAERAQFKATIIHSAAAIDCLVRADQWLERFAPRELATVVHEDGPRRKHFIQRCVEILRSEELMESEGMNKQARDELRLPLRRIIDTVHFATKPGARPLQLADLCAFVFGRFQQNKSVPNEAFELIWKRLRWLMPPEREVIRAMQEEAIASGELPPEAAEILRQSRARRTR
jgi:hypothetical protein